MNYKPYLRFHAEEVRFDGKDWQIAFTPRGVGWEDKMTRPIPQSEMQQIWRAAGITAALDDDNVRTYWRQIENGVRDFLIREYWSLDGKK